MKLDKRACRHAANAPLNISLNAGVLYTERVKCLVTAAVKLLGGHRALAVYFYECERLKANDRMPNGSCFRARMTLPRWSVMPRETSSGGIQCWKILWMKVSINLGNPVFSIKGRMELRFRTLSIKVQVASR